VLRLYQIYESYKYLKDLANATSTKWIKLALKKKKKKKAELELT